MYSMSVRSACDLSSTLVTLHSILQNTFVPANNYDLQNPLTARSKAWVYFRSLAGITSSNPVGRIDVSSECYMLSGRGLCVEPITRPEESYRVWCICAWSWSLDNEEGLAHWGLFYHGSKKPKISFGVQAESWEPWKYCYSAIMLISPFNLGNECINDYNRSETSTVALPTNKCAFVIWAHTPVVLHVQSTRNKENFMNKVIYP
jgi:hypothetical protein